MMRGKREDEKERETKKRENVEIKKGGKTHNREYEDRRNEKIKEILKRKIIS